MSVTCALDASSLLFNRRIRWRRLRTNLHERSRGLFATHECDRAHSIARQLLLWPATCRGAETVKPRSKPPSAGLKNHNHLALRRNSSISSIYNIGAGVRAAWFDIHSKRFGRGEAFKT